MTIDEMIAVLQASKEGKEIQFRRQEERTEWEYCYNGPLWNFSQYDYRVKPEPVEIEAWVHLDGSVISTTQQMGPGWTKKKFREVIE